MHKNGDCLKGYQNMDSAMESYGGDMARIYKIIVDKPVVYMYN